MILKVQKDKKMSSLAMTGHQGPFAIQLITLELQIRPQVYQLSLFGTKLKTILNRPFVFPLSMMQVMHIQRLQLPTKHRKLPYYH